MHVLRGTYAPRFAVLRNRGVNSLEEASMQSLMNLWQPWQDFNQIQQEMGRLFGQRMGKPSVPVGYPLVNVWANDALVVLTAEVPGLDPEQLDITINRNTIVLAGTRETGQPGEGETYYRRERPANNFSRTVELPIEVDPQSAEAEYAKGLLTLRLSRPAAHQPQKVTVKAS
jgi:HSP20 family protein